MRLCRIFLCTLFIKLPSHTPPKSIFGVFSRPNGLSGQPPGYALLSYRGTGVKPLIRMATRYNQPSKRGEGKRAAPPLFFPHPTTFQTGSGHH